MTDARSQATYQVRLGWGALALQSLAEADVIIIVDALAPEASADLIAQAQDLAHRPLVVQASLRSAAAAARRSYEAQLARGGRTAINLVLAGDDGAFAVEDYLAAGAVADVLIDLGIDHCSPDVAVANAGFRGLQNALKHLVSASATALELAAQGRQVEVKEAAKLNAEGKA